MDVNPVPAKQYEPNDWTLVGIVTSVTSGQP